MELSDSNPDFDLQATLRSVVTVRTNIPQNAMTAEHLGTERSGHGVVINDQGLVLTIGYVITEAESVWIIDNDGSALSAHVVGYDQQSGLGLVQALGKLAVDPALLGNSRKLVVGQHMLLAGGGGESQCLEVRIGGMHEFAGYWEYLLDKAIFTSPVHPSWGGAALLDYHGKVCGIGSLIMRAVTEEDESVEANMVIPIDELPPILNDLLRYGKRNEPPRPWLGWFVQDSNEGVSVIGTSDAGPAARAGIVSGDIIVEVDNVAVNGLPSLYRTVWNAGVAGVDLSVTIERDSQRHVIAITSMDRNSMLLGAIVH